MYMYITLIFLIESTHPFQYTSRLSCFNNLLPSGYSIPPGRFSSTCLWRFSAVLARSSYEIWPKKENLIPARMSPNKVHAGHLPLRGSVKVSQDTERKQNKKKHVRLKHQWREMAMSCTGPACVDEKHFHEAKAIGQSSSTYWRAANYNEDLARLILQ